MSEKLVTKIQKEYEEFVQYNILNKSLQFYKDILKEVREEYFNPKFCDKDTYLWRVKNGYYSSYNHPSDVRSKLFSYEFSIQNDHLSQLIYSLKSDGFKVMLFKTSFYVGIPGVR